MTTTALKDAPTGATEDQTIDGTDPDAGKLFDVPRVKVLADDSDPTILKIAFSGQIELDRAKPEDVAFYNNLRAGKTTELHADLHVAGQKRTHRRDSEGNVDAIVETKSLIITSLLETD